MCTCGVVKVPLVCMCSLGGGGKLWASVRWQRETAGECTLEGEGCGQEFAYGGCMLAGVPLQKCLDGYSGSAGERSMRVAAGKLRLHCT